MKHRIVLLIVTAMMLVMTATGCDNKDDKKNTAESTEITAAKSTENDSDVSGDIDSQATETDADVSQVENGAENPALADGTYTAEFDTDSSMFHVNEMKDGKGVLTVKDGKMSIEIALVSKNITNLYIGSAADAESDETNWIKPGVELIDYGDGTSEEVNTFVVPVEALDTEFELAIYGKKGKWYDHKVSVSDPQPYEEDKASESDAAGNSDGNNLSEKPGEAVDISSIEDGEYQVEVTLSGGSGKTTVESPAALKIEDGKAYATITLSSPYYDYMLVNDEKYEPVNDGGNSTFIIPVDAFDYEMPVVGDTTAMSTPHEIEYTLNFNSATIK